MLDNDDIKECIDTQYKMSDHMVTLPTREREREGKGEEGREIES